MAINYAAKIKALEAEKLALDASTESKTRKLEIDKLLAEIERDKLALTDASAEAMAEATREVIKQTNALKDNLAVQKLVNEEKERSKKVQDNFGSALGRTIKTLTGVTDASDTLVGSFLSFASEAESASDIVDEMKEVFSNAFSAFNVGTSIVRKLGEATFALAMANDKATAAFNKASGAAGAYDSELVALEASNIQHGLSTADMGASYGALQSSLSGFGVMAESERVRLGELGAQFAAIGVSGADFAGTLETMTTGFGMSTQAATGMQKEAMALAQTLGKDVGQVLSEMNAALPQLASYGSDAVDMFFDLEKQSQKTGMAVGELIGIAGNYRTFDSAAEAAGNLNSVLGTQLFSTMGLLEAQLESPEAVLEHITDNLHASISDYDSLSTFEKDSIANAAGIETSQLNQLMNAKNMSKEERDRAESLEDSMAAGRSLGEELAIFARNFAIGITPAMNFLKNSFQVINSSIATVTEALGPLVNIIKVMAGLWAGAFAIAGINGMIAAFGLLTGAIWGTVAALIARLAAMGPPGWAVLAIGAGIGIAATAKMVAGRDKHARGTDDTSGRMALVGEEGPELIVPPKHSAVVNNSTMTALAEQGAGGEGMGGSNTAVVAAVQALGQKLDAVVSALNASGDFVMQVDDREFGRVINSHFGEPGYQKIDLRTA